MQPKIPLLTIGIPTWNRAKELQKCLQALATQVSATSGEVDVLISDNASSDETQNVINDLQISLPFLGYSRNEKNMGLDRNILKVFRKASGKYIWLMSDDDLITEGSVCEILRIIRTHNPSYISTNFVACNDHGEIMPRIYQPRAKCMARRDLTCADANDVFSLRNHWLSFMSSNIFRRDLLDIAEYDRNLDLLPNWIQVYVVAHVLSRDPSGYISSHCAVKQRVGNLRFDRKTRIFYQPESFASVCERFSLDPRVRVQLYRGIRRIALPLRFYIQFEEERKEASSYIVPTYYRIAAQLGILRWFIKGAWRAKRFLVGKGFSLPRDVSDL